MYIEIAEKIINMRNADLALREELIRAGRLSAGYDPEMEAVHIRNATALEQIIDDIGYPAIEKVGEEANEAAWLVIQHAISCPEFMKKCARLLEAAVADGQADPKQLAYLTDRIAVFEGRSQLYGTQFDWDEAGEMSPNPVDDIEKVDHRRKAIGLNSLEEQTGIIRKQIMAEGQTPPSNLQLRNELSDQWRNKVGWST